MKPNLTLAEILKATQGVLLQEGGDSTDEFRLKISSFSTDSRTLQKGDLFVCLKGESFDAHDFLDEIIQKLPSVVLIQKEKWNSKRWQNSHIYFVGVKNTLGALGALAHAWRKKFFIPVVAITGSNGKTTTKDLAAAFLQEKYKTLATEGNLNNEIGVPLTLFRLREDHEAAVIEMGMNHLGEIARLTVMTEPTVGLITNVALAHLEELKNLEGVAKAKGELFEQMPAGTVVLVNQDDPWISKLHSRAYKISYGLENPADVFCAEHHLTESGTKFELRYFGKKYLFESSLIGKANLKNMMAAISIGFSLGVEGKAMQKALKNFKGRSMRMEVIPLTKEISILNDCYNANPSSMEAALETLKKIKKQNPGLAILGEMFEMGDFAIQAHQKVGRAVFHHQTGYLIAIGPYAKHMVDAAIQEGMNKNHCLALPDLRQRRISLWLKEELPGILFEWALKGKAILIKGSRGAKMEKVTEALKTCSRKIKIKCSTGSTTTI